MNYLFSLLKQTQTPLDFRFELLEKTHALFPSLPLSNLTSLLTYSKATNAYDAVWTIASVWSYLMDASLCDNDTKLMKEMEQALKVVSVRTCHVTCNNNYMYNYLK